MVTSGTIEPDELGGVVSSVVVLVPVVVGPVLPPMSVTLLRTCVIETLPSGHPDSDTTYGPLPVMAAVVQPPAFVKSSIDRPKTVSL